jgi:polyisoprenoid-binding protein YceI
MKKKVSAILAGIVLLLIAVLVGPWVYINWIKDDAPAPLSLDTVVDVSTTASVATEPGGIEGEWKIANDSTVGYRVKEILLGQDSEAVGRSNSVTGTLVINGNQVDSAEFSVDVATIHSDSTRRDSQFTGNIMDTATFPAAIFELSAPISLAAEIVAGDTVHAEATGDLTLRGTTKTISFAVDARFDGSTIQIAGSIDVVFAEWGIPNPSNPVVSTEDRGLLEFLLTFTR